MDRTDLVIGTPIANRHYQELEGLIGFFVNTLALRLKLGEKQNFIELLRPARQVTLDGYAHQDVGFEQLVGEFQVERTLSHSPLFQVLFSVENEQRELALQAQTLGGMRMSLASVESVIAKFDLSLGVVEREEGLSGTIEYNSDLFERSRIERMVGHWQVLLQAIVANPQQSIAHLPLLPRLREQLLVEWNDTQADYPQDVYPPDVDGSRTPDAVAVVMATDKSRCRRRKQLVLCRTERTSQPTGALFAEGGSRAWDAGGDLCGTVAGDDRGLAGHPQGRETYVPN